MEPVVILIAVFVVLLLINTPIAVAIALATFFTAIAALSSPDAAAKLVAQRMATGIDSFSLLAIPFFILSGMLMGKGGIARRLIDFAGALVGRFTGGLGYVNVITCMLFGSISGSAVAAVSSVGGFMIPEMNRQGYDRDFNVAVTITAATTGLIIPPSNIMIVYALVSGSVSIAALFFAGIVPGILVGLALMLVSGVISARRGYGGANRVGWTRISLTIFLMFLCAAVTMSVVFISLRMTLDRYLTGAQAGGIAAASPLVLAVLVCLLISVVCDWKHIFVTFFRAILSLLLIIIVLGGILGGFFTPTEAAAIAVAYSFILAVVIYKEVRLSEVPAILRESGTTTAVVMLLIGASSAMSWILAYERIPQDVSAALLALSDNKIVILLVINALLLIVGTFMDMTPAVLIFTPIFLPVAQALGLHPVHFGILMIANLCIGLCTPPVGTCLFVGCGVGKTTLSKVTIPLLPFFAAMVAALMVITYLPELSLFLPRLFGLI